MKIIVASICEHAWVENGCLSIARAFDSIAADKLPYTLPRISVALRILARRSESGEHKIDVVLIDADGKELMRANLGLNAQFAEDSPQELSYSFVLSGQNVVFPHAGDYAVDILVDGRVDTSIPLYLRLKS
jgi:hypothetical protein